MHDAVNPSPYGALSGEFPQFIRPQLATMREEPPAGDDWLHELKFDGYRIQGLFRNGAVRLVTRNRKDWTGRYRGIADAFARLEADSAVIDGELIAPGEEGAGDFGKLQQAAGSGGTELIYYAFDLLHLDGRDLRREPLLERKRRLRRLIGEIGDPIRYCDHIRGNGRRVFAEACRRKLEGIISKKARSPYRSGRGTAWIKCKCVNQDEFVIGGYRKSRKAGRPFASLLLGEYANGRLVYRGRVGTGFSERSMRKLSAEMKDLTRTVCPFHQPPAEARRDAVWLRPELVAQIGYWERTADGRLRHPRFIGLREDKPAQEVTVPESNGEGTVYSFRGVRLTNPGRIFYPDLGLTKRDLAEYYMRHAGQILPFVRGRPLALLRCPSGRGENCFFQKHHTDSTPSEIKTVMIEDAHGERSPCLLIESAKGLVAAAQIGALELHIWGARADRIEYPERIVFDLDPDESLQFAAVRAAALELRDVLGAGGLASFALLTGGKGIHVVVPLLRRCRWDEVKTFARSLAVRLAEAAPERYVAEASKARRRGRIFIDWMRNDRGATAIAPYSTRALPGAPVAAPVSWDELGHLESAASFTLGDAGGLRSRFGTDPWAGYHSTRQSITRAILRAVA